MAFTLTRFFLGLKAFIDTGVHNDEALEEDWEGGGCWDSVECRLKGGGCYQQGSVEDTGVTSRLVDNCFLFFW